MTAPNIITVSTITAKTNGYAVTDSLSSTGVANTASSGKVLKINSIICSNVDGAASVNVSVSVYKNATTHYYIGYLIAVPAKATLVVLGKDSNPVYLEENDAIYAVASALGDAQLLISYEEIS